MFDSGRKIKGGVMRRIDRVILSCRVVLYGRAILNGRVDTGDKLILSGWQKQGMCNRVGSVILVDGDRVILTSRVA